MRPAVRVFVAGSAEADLDAIADYFGDRNPAATDEMLARVADAVQLLTAHPYIGPRGRVNKTRELVVTQTPFVLVYTVDGETLIVMRVLHAQQQWPPEAGLEQGRNRIEESCHAEGYARKPVAKNEFDVWEKEQDWG